MKSKKSMKVKAHGQVLWFSKYVCGGWMVPRKPLSDGESGFFLVEKGLGSCRNIPNAIPMQLLEQRVMREFLEKLDM